MSGLFVIGAQRSGTTYLYNMLDSHPQILMAKPVRPEPKFFLDKSEWAKGKEYYESRFYNNRLKQQKYIGEKSTSYIEFKFVADRIKSYYPDARILIILRDPVERAYSNYRFSVENGIEDLSFFDALSAESTRISSAKYYASVNPYAYKHRGNYIDYIRGYTEVFDSAQIYVIIHEEFVSNREAIIGLFHWLGVDESCIPYSYKKKVNDSLAVPIVSPELLKCKSDLYDEFVNINAELEDYLGRKINVWKFK